jgi:hypothetical protein
MYFNNLDVLKMSFKILRSQLTKRNLSSIRKRKMFGLVFLAILGYMMYIEIITFFENRRDEKRTHEYFKNRSWQADNTL